MSLDPIVVISRLAHILGAILLMGGLMYIKLVLTPTAAQLPDEPRAALNEAASKRWRYWVAAGIAVLIFSGFYNYLAVLGPQHSDAGDRKYHMFMGIKMLLAFVVFFFASALAGRSKGLQGIRNKAGFWLTVTLVLATAVVALGSVLKVRGIPAKPAAAVSEQA